MVRLERALSKRSKGKSVKCDVGTWSDWKQLFQKGQNVNQSSVV